MDKHNKNSDVIKGNETSTSIIEANTSLRMTLLSIKNYIIDTNLFIERIKYNFKNKISNYIGILKCDLKTKFRRLQTATMKNHNFFLKLINYSGVNPDPPLCFNDYDLINPSDYFYYNKYMIELRNLLKEIVSDWSNENALVRNVYLDLILTDISCYFKSNLDQYHVAINSSGAGRLIYEIAKLGFKLEVVESSNLKCIFLKFILNSNCRIEEYEIQPFIYSFSNILDENSPFETIKFPDICPKLSSFDRISMINTSNGNQIEKFELFITFFTIHKAKNIFEEIVNIYKLLRRGGIWLNYGPLIYNDVEEGSLLQVSWENLKCFLCNIGFSILKEEIHTCPLIDIKFILQTQVFKSIYMIALKN